ncbi:hypothetical protein P691DRAFT_790940 [Macrolepiota fuliginosa MF-IS2]|uniref:Uncharacterized protein n=1 Tax=Macrolepiota fuliginosa MF-IS2 TaxID=1400762 RepID=A0A9P5WZ94_9AGAR|nr:hypothetical protein P691DRAFT_790940 [Macrolepiota fuliginosa MF-IS2]
MASPPPPQLTTNSHSHLLRYQNWSILFLRLLEIIILVFMLGIPYLKYRTHQHQQLASALPLAGQTRSNTGFRTIELNWEAYSLITAGTLPVILPVLSVSSLPTCSTAYFIATTALICGIVGFATCEIYKRHFEITQEEYLVDYQGERTKECNYTEYA